MKGFKVSKWLDLVSVNRSSLASYGNRRCSTKGGIVETENIWFSYKDRGDGGGPSQRLRNRTTAIWSKVVLRYTALTSSTASNTKAWTATDGGADSRLRHHRQQLGQRLTVKSDSLTSRRFFVVCCFFCKETKVSVLCVVKFF